MAPERERDRAVRIAYGHARRGDESAARRWLDVAAGFARTSGRQAEHVADLLRASGPAHIPGQLELVHAAARAQAAQAHAHGYRDAATRYGD